jgi:hypothetical protein
MGLSNDHKEEEEEEGEDLDTMEENVIIQQKNGPIPR